MLDRGKWAALTSSERTDAEPAFKTDPESALAQDASAQHSEIHKTPTTRRRRFIRVGIQSKLLMTLLICSILSVSVVGIIGAVTGRNALRQVEADA